MTGQPADREEDRLLLHALADGELDAATALVLERRIAGDPALSAEFESIKAVTGAIRRLEPPAVSETFLARIETLAPARRHDRRYPIALRGWRAMAASVMLTALVTGAATHWLLPGHSGFSIEDTVTASHRRSLLAANPVDIASSDRHTVKPWLDAKLGISPPATDLASSGYPLIGGRVDVVGRDAVPTLVYRHNEHLITLLAAPGSKAEQAPRSSRADGYNVVHWMNGGFDFWAISDLEPAELDAFVAAYRAG